MKQIGSIVIIAAILAFIVSAAALLIPANAAMSVTALDIRGTVWNEVATDGAINGAATWNPQNFGGLAYYIDGNLGKESISILQADLSKNQRTISSNNLVYKTTAEARMLTVVKEKFSSDPALAAAAGLERTGSGQAFYGGTYYLVGWQGEKYAAVNSKVNKLTKIILEQGKSTSEKKTLSTGESWDLGGGWTLQAQSIDAKANPRQVWLILSKDGVKKDDKVVYAQGVYTYVEKSFAGETDVPLFVTYVDSVFAGATSDMVQFKYTWLTSGTVTEIKNGDIFGVFKVTNVDTTAKSLELKNSYSVTLSQDYTVTLMGDMKFKVADRSDILRFYPRVDYVITEATPIPTPTPTPTGTATSTVTATGTPTTSAANATSTATPASTPTPTPTPATTPTSANCTIQINGPCSVAGYTTKLTSIDAPSSKVVLVATNAIGAVEQKILQEGDTYYFFSGGLEVKVKSVMGDLAELAIRMVYPSPTHSPTPTQIATAITAGTTNIATRTPTSVTTATTIPTTIPGARVDVTATTTAPKVTETQEVTSTPSEDSRSRPVVPRGTNSSASAGATTFTLFDFVRMLLCAFIPGVCK